ncbi:MAG: kelch repeat-containing protein [Parasphingorhabdus sp.]
MKKLLISLLALIGIITAGLFILRQTQGWNDGMGEARSEIHAAVLNSKIYVAGGIGLFRVLDSCETYDLESQRWANCAPLPRPLHHVAMAADKTKVYASGGYVALPFEQDQDAALFVLAPGKDRWRELAKLPHPIGQHAMVHLNGIIYIIGGQNGSEDLASLWAFDLTEKQWTEMASMPTARHSHAITVSENKLYVSGGRSAALGTEITAVEVYDFASDSWDILPKMPTGRGGHGSFIRTGKLHIFGGESLRDRKVLANHNILNLQTATWSTGPDMKFPRHGFAVGDNGTGHSATIIGGGAHPGLQTIYSVTGTNQTLEK